MRLPAAISGIRQKTPSIKSFTLDLGASEIGFSAGQWVDFFVTLEGAEAVGGYSITSSPAFQTSIALAVKKDNSGHAVTSWLHEDAQTGDEVEVSLGGGFLYTPDEADSVVLIGGGIGLTPLMSIVRSVDELAFKTRLTLIYSASTLDELLFKRELESIQSHNERIKCVFSITGAAPVGWDGRTGRINSDLLREESIDLDALFFLCGPPDMITAIVVALRDLGVPRPQIRYEQWW